MIFPVHWVSVSNAHSTPGWKYFHVILKTAWEWVAISQFNASTSELEILVSGKFSLRPHSSYIFVFVVVVALVSIIN